MSERTRRLHGGRCRAGPGESSRRAWTKGAQQPWPVCWSQDRSLADPRQAGSCERDHRPSGVISPSSSGQTAVPAELTVCKPGAGAGQAAGLWPVRQRFRDSSPGPSGLPWGERSIRGSLVTDKGSSPAVTVSPSPPGPPHAVPTSSGRPSSSDSESFLSLDGPLFLGSLSGVCSPALELARGDASWALTPAAVLTGS